MAFSSKNIQTNNIKEEPSKAPLSTFTQVMGLELTKEEIEVLLLTIKESSFKGEHVEKVYNLVYKLQQYYVTLKP